MQRSIINLFKNLKKRKIMQKNFKKNMINLYNDVKKEYKVNKPKNALK